ncbi:aspartic proteinase nepenthesin-2-like [Pyrus ussuriensis x Pyrus communis]|uniref:Aspartic proteinase nepenthesin-2-like n=1 Tax=Pyrus ussuriensis x Pyrus communis TaxID=2448454 RepID=A0A5N5GN23_9ROSA|nr:aspartic proteinase nepenthesin-2-like [Pyrus ussuriensis x Pyrus communis]
MAIKIFHILFNPQLNFITASTLDTNINTNQTRTNDLIRPKLQFELIATYIIQVGLGTFNAAFPTGPFKSYYLYIDTGSSLLWNLFQILSASPLRSPSSLQTRPMCRGFLLPGHYVHEQLCHPYHSRRHNLLAILTF